MEATYKKDESKSFMILTPEEFDEDDYKFQMIKNNTIKFLLPTKVKMIDNKNQLYYEITSKISLQSLCGKKLIEGKEFIHLIKNIKTMADSLKEYLLDTGQILFDPEYIFVDRQSGNHYFCYYPTADMEMQYSIRNLFDKLLEYVNHSDKVAVEIAYGIEQITINDSYSIREILEFAISKTKEEKRPEPELYTKEENIFEIPRKQPGLLNKIFDFFKKSKYQTKSVFSEDIDFENFGFEKEESIQDETDDATVFLSPNGNIYSITLKSVNLENPIVVTSNIYPCIFGKSRKSSDYVIDSPVVSRVHMKLSADHEGYYIEDLNSTNGTYKNGIRLQAHIPEIIEIGDKITIADIDFVVA